MANHSAAHSAQATFGAGCFWGVEKSFRRKFVPAALISNIRVGYAGGQTTNPSYEQVCSGKTGHAEVINFSYDPLQISFSTLCDFFFRMHDPTTTNQQGNDRGTQYRSVILYHDEKQKSDAEAAIGTAKLAYGGKVSTTLEPFTKFYEAEKYHQDYLTVNTNGYECATHFERTWEKIVKQYNGKMPPSL